MIIFINIHHSNGLKPVSFPIQELIYHKQPFYNRMFLKILIKILSNVFIPLTFICDTGVSMFIYLTELLKRLISGRIKMCKTKYILVNYRKMIVSISSPLYSDTNVLGLRALSRFSLHLTDNYFEFNNFPNYI